MLETTLIICRKHLNLIPEKYQLSTLLLNTPHFFKGVCSPHENLNCLVFYVKENPELIRVYW